MTLGQPSGGGPDISVVVTGHHEGELAIPTFRALARSVAAAVDAGLAVEVVGVLDRADATTTRVFDECLADGSTIGALAATRLVTTDLGDPGLARNAGVQGSRAPWVCVLDADNLPTGSWLVDAHRRASEHGGPCVVHPEHLVVFGARWEAWPQVATADPGFRRENFYDRTFWDTFCLASRQVFDQVSYVPTSAASGLGPEDWHWGMETVHAGFEHLVAPATALLYRVKPASVQQGHDEARSLLPPAGLLVDGSVAALRPAQPDDAATDDRTQLRGLQAAVVRPRPERRRAPRALTWLRRDAGPSDDFDVAHYRALNSDALHLDDDEAARHHLTVGRAEGRRGLLTPEELADVQRLRLDDYRTLHPDLAALTDDDLLHHYLLHGRVEGRAARMTTEQRDAARPVRLAPEVVAELAELHTLEPDVPEPTPEALAALRHVGPPMDGSVTAGSRAWWDLVRRVGDQPLDTVVFVGDGAGDDGLDALGGATDPSAAEGRVLVVDTAASPAEQPLPARDGVQVVHARDLGDWAHLTAAERRRLLATLVVQYRVPRVVVRGSADFEAAARDYERALGAVLAD